MFFTDFYRFIRIFREISGNFRKLREISKPIFTDNDRSHLIERSRTIYIVHARSGSFLNEPNYIVLKCRNSTYNYYLMLVIRLYDENLILESL